jgi:hypothetical protein
LAVPPRPFVRLAVVRVLWSTGDGADGEAEANTLSALRELLARLDGVRVDGLPLMVGIEAAQGSLTVGLGDDLETVLGYFPADGGGSWHSVGQPDRVGARAYWTMLHAYSELRDSSLIARADAEKAIALFVGSDGAQPGNVRWHRD